MTKVRFQSSETPVLLLGRLFISSEKAPKDVQAWKLNIPLFSPTWWSEKYKSIRIFKCNFKRILDALGFLMSNGSSDKRVKAFSLKPALEKFGVTYAVCLIGRC